jgi:hypothetical protein
MNAHRFIAVAAILVAAALALSGCEKERREKFMAVCAEAKFEASQCQFLYAMKKDAEDDSSSAAIMGGMALGMSAGRVK